MPLPARRRLRAPHEYGATLIDPPLAQIHSLVTSNRLSASTWDQLSGLPFARWRQQTRQWLVKISSSDLTEDKAQSRANQPFILTGHQPELFHPGVWFKNFLLDRIARDVGGIGINLIIDNDAVRSASIRVPETHHQPTTCLDIPFDGPAETMPWEERRVQDLPVFDSFAERVRYNFDPTCKIILNRFWTQAIDYRRKKLRNPVTGEPDESLLKHGWLMLSEVLAHARHNIEAEAGLSTWEQLLSHCCESFEFKEFAACLFSRATELHAVYNAALAAYRLQNGVRNRVQPLPDLERDGDWYEVPFWLWWDRSPQRRRAFVRQVGQSWELSDRQGVVVRPGASRFSNHVYPWEDLGSKVSLKLRPRALITTMYARLVLSDLFIHGIGGAKYDEVTDEIIRRFFGIEPPKYVTATATFRLPIDRPQVTIEDVRENFERQRDVRYRPESFVKDPLLAGQPAMAKELAALAAEKKEYVAKHALRRGSPEVFRGLDKLNRAMSELLAPVEQHLAREQTRLAEDLRIAGLLGSREFSFVLYPEEYLVPRLLELSRLPA